MTSQHDALYRAICAEPDEDTPRLAFADLIEEDGDSLRAAFIRSQIALNIILEYDPLHISTRQLNPDALTGWSMAHTLPQVRGGYGWDKFEFRRGFPWKVGVHALEAFVDHGAGLFDLAPIQALTIHVPKPSVAMMFADWPHLARIRRLEFAIGRVEPDATARLCDSPHAAALTELAFEYDGIAAEGLETLARSAVFSRLTALELRSIVIPPPLLVDALAAAREPSGLRQLSLPFNRITHHDADQLFALPALQGLEHLDLSDNSQLGVEGVRSLAESGVLRGLRVLKLSKTLPGVPGIRALTETGNLTGLRSLDLSANRLGPVAVKLLAESRAARGLRVLNLANNPVGDAGASAIANAPAFADLLELDLGETGLSDAGALALAESPNLGNLLRLNLTNPRPFGDKARAMLVERFGKRVTLG